MLREKIFSDLRRVLHLIWLLVGGGSILFFTGLFVLGKIHRAAPAETLINWRTVWLLLTPVVMVFAGVYISGRYGRCPFCRQHLSTHYPIRRTCSRCGRDVRLYQ